jgi:ankyrin repeat protein
MHLNAFHLAVENGHFEIMNMFLKMNSSLADIISLYQASKNVYLVMARFTGFLYYQTGNNKELK